MPLLMTEAAKLAEDDRQRGIIEELIDKDELFALVPFVRSKDDVYAYDREKTLPGAGWIDPYDDIEESTATFEPVTARIKILAGQVDIANFISEVKSDLYDQVAVQLAAKAKGVGRDFRQALVNGDSAVNPKQFDGLKKFVTAGQTLTAGANGNALSYSMLDELKDAVKLGADCLMMRQGTWRALRQLNRLQGGNTADMMMIENFGVPVKAYDGTPVIINDYIGADETQGDNDATTSIYALRLNEADGFHGLYAGDAAGIRVEKVGLNFGKDSTRWRLKWYCAAALKATHAVARLKGVTNI
ncbi:major capsid protein [Ancylobacter rudongensis]|uniref:Phage major capsid protein, HK97 family n=1 Tax=Ancylobacter rudongensis TaxID=177413 RepID=A0A1G4UQ10_9HYPH|nr:phage major capsid protein [Ancylobacter rudongensis]SCW95637.1 phage major capsid protein, HK97 family [Ancylobacter rudongensis]